MRRPAERHRLVGIQAGRGVAALLVVAYHGGRMLALPQYLGYPPLGNVFAFGHAGVDFFFVLSGFIITYVHGDELGQPQRVGRYLWRRATRIYPIYWLVTALAVAVAVLSPERDARLAPVPLIASFLLVAHGEEPVLGVAWTLEHEMLFYALFAVAIWQRRLAVPLLLAAAALVGAVLAGGAARGSALGFLGDPYHLQFLLGIGAALVVRHGVVAAPRSLAAFGVVAFLAFGAVEDCGLIDPSGVLGRLLFGLASVPILVGLAVAERNGLLRLGRGAAALGAASYAIYLIHTIVIGLGARLCAGLGLTGMLPGWSLLVLLGGLAAAVGLALHAGVEVPLMHTLNRLSLDRRAHPVDRRAPVTRDLRNQGNHR